MSNELLLSSSPGPEAAPGPARPVGRPFLERGVLPPPVLLGLRRGAPDDRPGRDRLLELDDLQRRQPTRSQARNTTY